jgi:hypothetical protein
MKLNFQACALLTIEELAWLQLHEKNGENFEVESFAIIQTSSRT